MAYADELKPRLTNIGINLAIIAALYFVLGLGKVLTLVIAGLVVVSGLIPGRAGEIIGALGWFVVAGVAYFQYGSTRIALVLAICGVIFTGLALGKLRK